MSHRAKLSGLDTWYQSSPPGAQFIGSADFPAGLLSTVHKRDPAGMFLSKEDGRCNTKGSGVHTSGKECLSYSDYIAGKKLLVLSGACDTIVPYTCAKPFIDYTKSIIAGDQRLSDSGACLEDKVFSDTGHEMSNEMVQEALKFIYGTIPAAMK